MLQKFLARMAIRSIKPTVGGNVEKILACRRCNIECIQLSSQKRWLIILLQDMMVGSLEMLVYEFVETGKDFGPWKHAN